MSTFICPHCGTATDIFAHGGAQSEAKRLEVPFLGEVPLTLAIREMSDAGKPVVVSAPSSPAADAYRSIAAKTWAELERDKKSARAAPSIVMES
jgi:ATP-binding protein involved in chromosome partitioning